MEDSEKGRLALVVECLEAGLWPAAERLCRSLSVDDPASILLRGLALAGKGEIMAAAGLLDAVARARPDHAHPCDDFATLAPAGRVADLYRACLALAPDDARLRYRFAAWLLDRDGASEAEAVLQPARDSAARHHALGLASMEQGKFAAAADRFRRATMLDPVPSIAWANLGMALKIEGRFTEALAAYDEAIARSPADVAIRVNRMVALLHAGRWTEAWANGDWRLRLSGYRGLPAETLLRPDAGVAGRTVLLTHEEGFGDTLQFLRYAPLLARRGARVLVRVPPPLARIAWRVPGVADVMLETDPLPRFDWHCPMVSLPRAFATTPDTIPPGDYLKMPAEPAVGRAVGLVWAGQARPWLPGFTALDRRRSAGAGVFSALAAVPNLRFVSLQCGEPAAHPPPGLALSEPMQDVRDFADTATLVADLDAVVSVDTAIVHLAGAMGKPVFMLDRYDNCWRWLSGRADTAWYPAMTIFRQETPGDWTLPMQRLVAALAAWAVS